MSDTVKLAIGIVLLGLFTGYLTLGEKGEDFIDDSKDRIEDKIDDKVDDAKDSLDL